MEPDKHKAGVWLRRAHKGFGERSFPSRTKYATPPAGRTAPATVYKCALVNKGLMACQNGSALNQAAGANPAFFVSLLVLQNLLAVFKLPDLLQDFLPFFFWGLGCNFFVHVMHLFSLETLID